MNKFNLPVNYDELHFSDRRLVREQYIEQQGGICSHCGVSLNHAPHKNILAKKVDKSLFPENFFKYPVHLHHDHDSGMTIGAVHNYCNAVLWQYHGE